MKKRVKTFGHYSVTVILEKGVWNLHYDMNENINVTNPSSEDLEKLDSIYVQVNQMRNLLTVVGKWIDQHHKGYVSTEQFEKKMDLYFDD